MRLRRKIPVFVVLLICLVALTAVIELRKHAPPEPARLLPGADGFVYANFSWMRLTEVAGKLPSVPHDPEYEQFIQATDFQFERDLEQAAFAIHYASPATRGQTRFSEVLVAHFNSEKIRAYFKSLAKSIDNYNKVDIYNIPLEDRTLRVAILGVDTVAASNHDDPAVIRGIVDRSRKLASPFGGPALLRQFYKRLPQLPPRLGWAIFKVNPSLMLGSAEIPLTGPATVVASVRYLGAVHLTAQAFLKDEVTAQQLSLQANTFLKIFESAETSVSGQAPDPDFQRALNSIKIEQKKESVVLSAIVPAELLRKLVAEAPRGIAAPGQ